MSDLSVGSAWRTTGSACEWCFQRYGNNTGYSAPRAIIHHCSACIIREKMELMLYSYSLIQKTETFDFEEEHNQRYTRDTEIF